MKIKGIERIIIIVSSLLLMSIGVYLWYITKDFDPEIPMNMFQRIMIFAGPFLGGILGLLIAERDHLMAQRKLARKIESSE